MVRLGAYEASLGDLHYKCIMQAWSNKTNPKQVYGMVKHDQKPTEMDSTEAKHTCYFDELWMELHYTYYMHAKYDQTSHGKGQGRS